MVWSTLELGIKYRHVVYRLQMTEQKYVAAGIDFDMYNTKPAT